MQKFLFERPDLRLNNNKIAWRQLAEQLKIGYRRDNNNKNISSNGWRKKQQQQQQQRMKLCVTRLLLWLPRCFLSFVDVLLQSTHWHDWNGLSINSFLQQHVTHED